jgi:hypothetical protein
VAQIDEIKHGLRETGLMEERDYVLDVQFASGDYRLFPEMARKLAQAGARLLLAQTISSVRAAQNVSPPCRSLCSQSMIQWVPALWQVSRVRAGIRRGWQH